MKKKTLILAIMSLIGTSQALLAGQDTALTLGKVEVTADKIGVLGSEDVLTSVNIIEEEYIENQNVDNTNELMKIIPGLYSTDFNQGVITGDFAIRGFNSEGGVPAVKLLIDGIPSNFNNGFSNLQSVAPLNIERLTLVKGTNDPRYGLHNLAGNLNVTTKRGGNYNKAKLLLGSFNTIDAQLSSAIESDEFSQNYSVGYRKSDGYRDHSESNRLVLGGKWFYEPENKPFSIGIIARMASLDADSPGYLIKGETDNVKRTGSPSFSSEDGGTQEDRHLSLHLDYDIANDLSWSFKTYGQTFQRNRFVRFREAWGQSERVQDEKQTGAISVLTYRPKVDFVKDLALEWGVDYHNQDVIYQRYETTARHRDRARSDHDFNLSNIGSYVQVDTTPVQNLRVTAAVRVDRFDGDFTQAQTFKANGSQREPALNKKLSDYGSIIQPKISAVYTIDEHYNLYGNWGRTFQIVSGTKSYFEDGQQGVEASINNGWEVGVKADLSRNIYARIGVWEQTATNEIKYNFADPSASTNIGETKRTGVDVEVIANLTNYLNIWGSYTHQKAEIVKPADASATATKGKEIDHVPNYIAKLGADYQATTNLKIASSINVQDGYYIERENIDGKFGAQTIVDLDAYYQWNKVTFGAHIKNLLNDKHDYVWKLGSREMHGPGDGVSGALTATVDF